MRVKRRIFLLLSWACGTLSLGSNHANAWQEYGHPYVPGSQQLAPSGQGGDLAPPGVHGAANRAVVRPEGSGYYIQRDPNTGGLRYEPYEVGADYASSRYDVSGTPSRGYESPAYGVHSPATDSYGNRNDFRQGASFGTDGRNWRREESQGYAARGSWGVPVTTWGSGLESIYHRESDRPALAVESDQEAYWDYRQTSGGHPNQDDYRPDADDRRPALGDGSVDRRGPLPGARGVYYPGITEFAAELSRDARFEYGVPIHGGMPYNDLAMPSWAGRPPDAAFRLPTSGPEYLPQRPEPGVYRHRQVGPHVPEQGYPSADSAPGVVRIEYWTTPD